MAWSTRDIGVPDFGVECNAAELATMSVVTTDVGA